MSDFVIEYDVLESVMGYSKDLERQANDYAEELEQNIVTAIDNITGASSGNLTNARDLVSDKIKMLKRKSDNFNHLANQISDLLEVAIQMDQEVADTIAMQSRYKLVHNESGRLENWIDKILKLLVSIGDNKLVMKLIADRLKALFPGSRFTKDFIIEWYKEALTEYVYYEKSDWMSGYGKEVRLFPDLKNDPDNGNVNLKNVIKNWYKNPDPKQNSKTEDKEDRNLLPYEQDLKKLLTARNLPQAYRYLFKYLWDRYPGLYSEQMKQMAIIGGMDPEWAEIYGDFATMPLLEGFAVVTVKGVQAIKNLKTGEIIYSESVVAGSGVGNLTNKASGGPKGIREGAGNAGKAIKGSGNAGKAIEGGSKSSAISVTEATPPGSSHPVKVYTDGNAQINTGKIDTYIRGNIKEPSNYGELKQRIKDLKKIQNNNPSEFTKTMNKELIAGEKTVHNYERSKGMGELLNDAGIVDTPKNNEMIAKSILNAAKEVTPENTKIVSYIKGTNKTVLVESWWIIDSDGIPYCSTIILKAVK